MAAVLPMCFWLLMGGVIATWWQLGGAAAAILFLPAWFVFAQVIFIGSYETARMRRHAWLGQYLQPQSSWHHLLQGGVLMVIGHQLLSLTLALTLLLTLRQCKPLEICILLAALILYIALMHWLNRKSRLHIIPKFRHPLTRRVSVPLFTPALILVWATAKLSYDQPYLIDVLWLDAIHRHVSSDAGDGLLGSFERLGLVFNTSALWAIQNGLELLELNQSPAKPPVWLLYFASQTIPAWACIRLYAGADSVLNHIKASRRERGRVSAEIQ